MQQANIRNILYFDLAMTPHPPDAEAIHLKTLMPLLEERCANKQAYDIIDSERRVVRLAATKRIKRDGKPDCVAMLFCLGDKSKAEPGFTHFETGQVRIVHPEEGEAGGLSVHAVVELEPTKKDGHIYRLVYEDVTGFGRSLIQRFLTGQFKLICEEIDAHYFRDKKRKIKTRPLVDLTGHAGDKIKNSILQGRLLYIDLFTTIEESWGFDEAKFIKQARQDISLSIKRTLPHGDALNMIEKVKVWAKNNGYANMRVRWREEGAQKPQSAKIDTARNDAGEALFIKSTEVSLRTPLPDISASICSELVDKMAEILA